jgi:hypothetical protein
MLVAAITAALDVGDARGHVSALGIVQMPAVPILGDHEIERAAARLGLYDPMTRARAGARSGATFGSLNQSDADVGL